MKAVEVLEDVEDGGTSRSVEEDAEDGAKPVEDGGPSPSKLGEDDVVEFMDEGTAVPACEAVPRCAAFPRAADDLQISCSLSK